MTQIITGTGLGLRNSSLNLGNYGPKNIASLGQGGTSLYLNAANGNLVIRQSDGFLADAGFGIDLFQTYNSRAEVGNAWCFNVQSHLTFFGEVNHENSSILRTDEDGHATRFLWDSKKQYYRAEEGGTARLRQTSEGWVYSEGNQKTSSYYTFKGQLTQIRDLDGHHVSLTYEQNLLSSITDTSGKQKITWVLQQGQIQDVFTSSEGQVIHHLHYDYDADKRLHRISRDLGQGKTYWITYAYVGNSNWISDILQSDGTQVHIDYDAQGRVKKLIDGEGRFTQYEYREGQTLSINGEGESWTYFYDKNNHLTGVDGPEQYRIRYDYVDNQLSSIIQGGQIWRFDYNEDGDCIRLEEPTGQITQRIFDTEHHLLAEIQYPAFSSKDHLIAPAKTTRFIYDARGHLTFVIAANGTVTEHRYNQERLLLSTRCYLQASYDLGSLSISALLSQEELSTWVAQQNPEEISLRDYFYDWRGQLVEEIHYSEVNNTGIGLAAGALSTYTRYDAAGHLIEKTLPTATGWSTTHYFYDDLGRLIQTLDNQKNLQSIDYDDTHQRIIQTDSKGLQTLNLYDRSGLLLATTRLDAQHDYGSTLYQYDKAGRLIASTEVDGKTRYFFYDAQGRLHAKINASEQMTQYRYTDEGLLLQTLQYDNLINTTDFLKHMPSFESIKPKSSQKDRISQIVYNPLNQIAYRIDAQGGIVAFMYDAQGLLQSQTAYANRLTDFNPQILLSFDSIKPCAENHDRSLFYFYDLQGRLSAQINAEGFATSYQYNRLGNIIDTCHYATKIDESFRWDWRYNKPTISSKDIHSYSLYDARGLKIADIDGERYLIEYRYNERGLLQERYAYEQAISQSILIDESTSLRLIRPQTGANDHVTTYQYNDLNLLLEEKTQSACITTYAYDEMGLLLSKTVSDEKTHSLRQQVTRYDALGRIIQQLDESGAKLLHQAPLSTQQIEEIWQHHSMSYTYNQKGLMQTKTNALQQTTTYFYNEKNQLKYSISADGAVIETHYTHFNQVESIRKYSTYLKGALNSLSTENIQTQLKQLKEDNLDETTVYEYDNSGQIVAKKTGSHGLVTSHYTAFGELESSTTSLDAQHDTQLAYTFDKRGLLINQIDDVKGFARNTSIEYDAFGWVTQKMDGRVHSTRYLLNKRGERISLHNELNQFKVISYDAFGRIVEETDYTHSQYVAVYSYDDKNNTLTLKNPQQHTQIITQFNAWGDQITLIDANGNTRAFHYNEQGKLIRVDAPEGFCNEYHYNELGELLWQEEGQSHVIAYSYDSEGHVLSKTVDPEGLRLCTLYQYDGIGRQLTITEANGCVKQLTYDNQGHLIQACVDPNGLNLQTLLTYDNQGLLLTQTEINPQGKNKVTEFLWDALGRRSATITDPDGLNLISRYQYDANDNLISQTDANGHTKHWVYDANNRCRFQIDACGVVTEHRYDINSNELCTRIYAHAIPSLSQYSEDTLNAALISDVQDQYQFRRFDSCNRVLCSYDALGYATVYTYDLQGNLIQKTQYLKPVSVETLKQGQDVLPDRQNARCDYFAYDGLNHLRFQCNTQGYFTEFVYDLSGQLIAETRYAHGLVFNETKAYTLDYFKKNTPADPNNDLTTYTRYDKAGRLCLKISAKGAATSYQYNELSQLISTTQHALLLSFDSVFEEALLEKQNSALTQNAADRSTHFVYDAAGREIFRISSEGRVIERCYDGVGNVIAQIKHAQRILNTGSTAEELAKALQREEPVRATEFAYDAAGRLLSQTNAKKEMTHYTYDAKSNVASKTHANGALWTYRYDAVDQLIESISPEVELSTAQGQEKRSISTQTHYDAFGNVICEIHDASSIQQMRLYEYDKLNRKIKTIYPDVHINTASNTASNQRQERTETLCEEIRYNALGDVIARCDKSGHWSYFVYDTLGHLIVHLNTQTAATQHAYDAFGRRISTTRFSTPNPVTPDNDFSIETFVKTQSNTSADRNEYFMYDKDSQLIEHSRDTVRLYDAKTDQYNVSLKPSTHYTYNAFGEVIQKATRLNETQWAKTYTYYTQDGYQAACINAEAYLTTYTQNAFGETQDMREYALRTPYWDLEQFTPPNTTSKDRSISYTYDLLGQLTSTTRNQVNSQRIKQGALEECVCDLTTSYCYDALGHLTKSTDPKGNSTYYYYDALGQCTTQILPQTQAGRAATTYAYDALGSLVEIKHWASGALLADSEHFILNGATNQDIMTHREYDTQGQLICEINGLNHTLEYSYDANGRLARSFSTLTQIDGSSLIKDKRYTYDSEGHLLQTATFKNETTCKTEDAHYTIFGELKAKGINQQYNIQIDYDNLGRVWRSNLQGYYQIYVYDLADNLSQVLTSTNSFHPQYQNRGIDLSTADCTEFATYFNQDSWRYALQRQNNTYDAQGHLLTQSKESTTAEIENGKPKLEYHNQSQTVDRWGNMLTHTNALGYQTRYEYNVFDHVIWQELPEVATMDAQGRRQQIKPINRFAYNELGQMIAMMDANGHQSTQEYDAQSNVIAQTDTKGHSRNKHYTLLNQLDSMSNELNALTRYTYDKANRLLSISTPKTQQTYLYDEEDHLIQQTNKAGDHTRFKYDSSGNQISTQDSRGFESVFDYDDSGHKIKETDANGNSQTWSYSDDGRLQHHQDLGKHLSTYEYNTNGLLIHEYASQGKNIHYHYQGDGALIEYADDARSEVAHYIYDAEGQLLQKESGRTGNAQEGFIRELDHYQYDALGRLITIRRCNPKDTDTRFPDKDHALLSVAYDYDAVGNIRHTDVSSNETGYQTVHSDEYYTYDENNRMTMNKGQLINDHIEITATQGNTLAYDAAGNICETTQYANNELQNYQYSYTQDNQIELIQKNNLNLQSKVYDAAGRVIQESAFDTKNHLAQRNQMTYHEGFLTRQTTLDQALKEQSQATYDYDKAGNITQWAIKNQGKKNHPAFNLRHQYTYTLWESYQQENDEVTLSYEGHSTHHGQSTRIYDMNGLLQDAIDTKVDSNGKTNTTHYWNSSIEGIKARENNEGKTTYLTIAGQTIGDLHWDNQHKQQITIYGGFTPTGSQSKTPSMRHTPAQTPIEAPQDSLGCYTLQAGDSLENVALTVYGDKGLWYLIADANGITDRNASASNDGPLYIGQRLNIPRVATGLHHTNTTHKVLNANQKIGNTTATTVLAFPTPLPQKHHGLFAKIFVAVITAVTTVLTAGVFGIGGLAELTRLVQAGLSALTGGTLSTTASTLIAGFSAGFIGNIAGQTVANILGLQKKIDLNGALISGFVTAATAGLGRSHVLNALNESITNLPINQNFNFATSAEMMEQNLLNQGLNLSLRKHQHFDWEELGTSTITAGILGGNLGKQINASLNHFDKKAGILSTELKALIEAGTRSALTGTHFDARQVLTDNLGETLSVALVKANTNTTKTPLELIDDLSLSTELAEIKQDAQAFNHYLARQLEGNAGYSDLLAQVNEFHEYSPAPSSKPSSLFPITENFCSIAKNDKELISNWVSPPRILGILAMKYETSKEANEYLLAAGVVSTGKRDKGGLSYGAFQIASATDIHQFLKGDGAAWASEFIGLDPTKPGAFGNKWKEIAATQGEAFFRAQQAYICKGNYADVKTYLQQHTGMNVDAQPLAVQEAILSASVQHRNAKFFLEKAINSLGDLKSSSAQYPFALINAIYDKRISYVLSLHIENTETLIYKRYPEERQHALKMLKEH